MVVEAATSSLIEGASPEAILKAERGWRPRQAARPPRRRPVSDARRLRPGAQQALGFVPVAVAGGQIGSADTCKPKPRRRGAPGWSAVRSEEHTSEIQSHHVLVCRLLLEKKTLSPLCQILDFDHGESLDVDLRKTVFQSGVKVEKIL